MTDPMQDLIDSPLEWNAGERHMTKRLSDYWRLLRGSRAYPSLSDFKVEAVPDFTKYSFVLDLTGDPNQPNLRFVGTAHYAECGQDLTRKPLSDAPDTSVLKRVEAHYRQVVETKGAVMFEGEHVNMHGRSTAYRGIMLPFGEDARAVTHIIGAIGWKILSAQTIPVPIPHPQAALPGAAAPELVGVVAESATAAARPTNGLSWRLKEARTQARGIVATNAGSIQDLHAALEAAYAVHLAAETDRESYVKLLGQFGIEQQKRAPFVALVKLVFGAQIDELRVSEYAAALSFAKRRDLSVDAVARMFATQDGGIKVCVAAERIARKVEQGLREDLAQANLLPRLRRAGVPDSTATKSS